MIVTRRRVMENIEGYIGKLFQKNLVLDMPTLQQNLNGKSKRTIHRYLNAVRYYSSYTHSGKYFTLEQTPSFDSNGIWFYNKIGFSKYGTLKNSLIEIIEASLAGKAHAELKKDLLIDVHNSLLELLREEKIKRISINNFYIYFSADEKKSSTQLKKRRELMSKTKPIISLPSPLIRIEILSEIVRSSNVKYNEEEILCRLKNRDVVIDRDDLERTIIFYDIKKNATRNR